jgi:hypothetical protein
MAHLESFGTLDKLSELHSMTKTHKTVEEPEEYVDFDALGGFQLLDLIITELKSHMTC